METKYCPKCKNFIALSEFGMDSNRKNGVRPYCKPCSREVNRVSRLNNMDSHRASEKKWRDNNKDKIKSRQDRWNSKNPGRINELSSAWQKRNRERVRENQKKRHDSRPEIRAMRSMSTRIRNILIGKGGRKTKEIVGYGHKELRSHLERQFTKGMSWENYGEWHIDHIQPLSSFDIKTIDDDEMRSAWALTNLRPIWAKENLTKHDRRVYLI